MNAAQVTGLVRHGLTFAAGILMTKMNMDAATYSALAGAVALIVGIIWSFATKQPVTADVINASASQFAAINTAVDTELKDYPAKPAMFVSETVTTKTVKKPAKKKAKK